MVKNKIKTENQQVQKVLQAAYGRSILFYFSTPLVVNSVWTLEEVSNYEYK